MIDSVVCQSLRVNGNVHSDQHRLNFLCFSVIFRQESQTLFVHLFKVGFALCVVSKYFVQKSNRIECSHDWSEDNTDLVILIGLLEVL